MTRRVALWIAVAAGALGAAGAPAQTVTSDQLIRSLSRGIRPVAPPEAGGTRTGHGQPPAPPPQSAAQPSANLTVRFKTGSAELTPAARRTLDELGRALSSTALAGYRFRVEGHTDTVGSPQANKSLSEQRANKVRDYLASNWGVDPSRIEAVGVGQEHLLVRTGPNVPNGQNRRVTVINLGA